ncbi:MAG: acetate--CoA ligase family protein [Deltaproteobacteria bacterium]|nr:acetate--CoA ligase family protein [Deltaproteobacteria bacterium]
MAKNEKSYVIIAGDKKTADYIQSRVFYLTDELSICFISSKGWQGRVEKAITDIENPVVLMSAFNIEDSWPVTLVEQSQKKGLFLLWDSISYQKDDNADESGWLFNEILSNRGAVKSDSLDMLIEYAHLFKKTSKDKVRTAGVKKGRSEILKRLDSLLKESIVNNKPDIVLNPGTDSYITAAGKSFDIKMKSSIKDICEAVSVLCKSNQTVHNVKAPDIIIKDEELALIVMPPKRVLSEITSKRILDGFGLEFPIEKICSSSSSAINFLKEQGESIVLKLVKPALTDKETMGAVIKDLSSSSSIRQAFHHLLELSKVNSPPQSLGIMACCQIKYEKSFWIKLAFGPLKLPMLIIGRGDCKDNNRVTAIDVHLDFNMIMEMIANNFKELDSDENYNFAVAVYKISAAVKKLEDSMFMLEIHPLVLSDKRQALVLDALIGIGES